MGEKVLTFETNDKVVKYFAENGFNDVKIPFAYGNENNFFMLHQKNFPIQEYETSTIKNENQYLYKKDELLKGDNITVENEGIVDYGTDLII